MSHPPAVVKRESWRPQPTSSWAPNHHNTQSDINTGPSHSSSTASRQYQDMDRPGMYASQPTVGNNIRSSEGNGNDGDNGAGPSRWGRRAEAGDAFRGGYNGPEYGRGGFVGNQNVERGGRRSSPDKWERDRDFRRDERGGGSATNVRGRIPPSGPRDMGGNGGDNRDGSCGGRGHPEGERSWGAWREKVDLAESRRNEGGGTNWSEDRRDSAGWGNAGFDARRGGVGRGGYGPGPGPGPGHGHGRDVAHGYDGSGPGTIPPSGPKGDRLSGPGPARTSNGGDSWRPDTSSSSSRTVVSYTHRPRSPITQETGRSVRGRGSPDYGVGGAPRGRSRSRSRSSSNPPVTRRTQRSRSPRKRDPSITRRSRSREKDKRMRRGVSPYSVNSRPRRSRSGSRESRLDVVRGDSPKRNANGMRKWGTAQQSPVVERRIPDQSQREGSSNSYNTSNLDSQSDQYRQRLHTSQSVEEEKSRAGRSLREQFESNRMNAGMSQAQNQPRQYQGVDPHHEKYTGGPAAPPSPPPSRTGRQVSLRDQFQSTANRPSQDTYPPPTMLGSLGLDRTTLPVQAKYPEHPSQSSHAFGETVGATHSDQPIDPQPPSTNAPVQPPQPIRIAFNASVQKSPTKPSSWKTISMPPKSAVSHLFEDPSTSNTVTPIPSAPTSPVGIKGQEYTRFLSSLPPYLQAAFGQWWEQGHEGRPELRGFLRHYFGREASPGELEMVEKAADLRSGAIDAGQRKAGSRVEGDDSGGRRSDVRTEHRHRGSDALDRRDNGWGRDDQGERAGGRRSWKDRDRDDQRDRESDREMERPIGPRTGPGGGGGSSNMIPVPAGTSRYPKQASPTTDPTPLPASESTPPSTAETPHIQSATPMTISTIPPPQLATTSPINRTTPVKSGHAELYERLDCVGEGTYGKVYKARNSVNGVFVALKRIRMEGEKDGFPVTAMREIKLLQILTHVNVVRLHEMMVSKGSVYMVMEYMDHDLTGLLSHPEITFSASNLKSLNHQMLSGLAYLHANSILHRDMKGSNILLNAKGELKLADFGLARVYERGRRADYTNRVITLWYRSPELLLGETVYGGEVDCWSAGCIMLELYVTKPVFQGNDEIHQLEVIYSVMGTPSEVDWPGLKELPWYELVKPKESISSRFREYFKKWLSPAALDLAEGLLFFDPTRRLTAAAALKTPYFTTEEPAMELPSQLAGCGEHHEMSAKLERHKKRLESR